MVHANPPSGSRILHFAHTNVTIFCDVEGAEQMTWAFIMAAPHVPGGYSFTAISNSDRFIISDGRMNRLTIVDFDEDLDGSTIVCGIVGHVDIEAAIFSLHVAGKRA